MTNVLIVAGEPPRQEAVLIRALEQFQAKGCRVQLVGDFVADQFSVDPALAEFHALAGTTTRTSARRSLNRAQPSRRLWLRAWRDPWVRQHARQADIVVALDALAVYTVWEISQRQHRSDAWHGLTPALKAVDVRSREGYRPAPLPLRRAVSATAGIMLRGIRRSAVAGVTETVRATMAPTIIRTRAGAWLWRRAVSAPGLPDGLRSRLTYRVHVKMVRAGEPAAAAQTSAAAAVHLKNRRIRADLLMREATEELSMGEVPVCLPAAVSAELVVADDLYAKKDFRKSAQALYKAMRLLFHRIVHFDQLSSPLVSDPAVFFAPLRASVAAQALATPRNRVVPAAGRPGGRPLRLLIATNGNDHFLREIRQHYENLPEVELRFVHFKNDPVSEPLTHKAGQIVEHLLAGESEYGKQVEEWLRPHLDWADTIFVDWCLAAAAMVTLVDPGTTRVIVRLHSFEALSFWPHLVDFSRVDDLIFVSDHLRDLTTAVLPELTTENSPRLHVISNAMDLSLYPRDKQANARFTLGLVGISAVAKDPRWTVEVLRLMRDQDPRYRLLLIGDGPNPEASESVRHYHDLLTQDLAELEPSGAIVRLGQVTDVPQALTEVGVIISSSVRESFHCGLVEGAASGAVPVVRDWPFFSGMAHGARTLFPSDWVVSTPAEAAERILKLTASEELWRSAGEAATAHTIATWDWPVTREYFDALILNTPDRQEPANLLR